MTSGEESALYWFVGGKKPMPRLRMPNLVTHLGGCMGPAATIALLLAAFSPLCAAEIPARIFFSDAAHPVASGEAWLAANRWGAYEAVLVGTVQDGKFERRKAVQFPKYWEQAFDYKLLFAVSDDAVGPPQSMETNDAYGWFGRRPDYLKRFPVVYVSAPLAKENGGRDWGTALNGLGPAVRVHILLSDATLCPLRPCR